MEAPIEKRERCVTIRCSLAKVQKMFSHMCEDEIAAFEDTCFGFMSKLKSKTNSFNISVTLVASVLRYWKHGDLFEINGVNVRFSPLDVALIFNMSVLEPPKLQYTKSNPSTFRERIFGTSTVLEKRVSEELNLLLAKENKAEEEVEDLKRLRLLFLIGNFFLPNSARNIDYKFVDLANNLEDFNKYPWGREIYKNMVWSFQNAHGNLNNRSFCIYGCVMALQIWCYMHIPEVAVAQIENQYPRLLGWKLATMRKTVTTLEKTIMNAMVVDSVEVELEEKGIEAVAEALEMQEFFEEEPSESETSEMEVEEVNNKKGKQVHRKENRENAKHGGEERKHMRKKETEEVQRLQKRTKTLQGDGSLEAMIKLLLMDGARQRDMIEQLRRRVSQLEQNAESKQRERTTMTSFSASSDEEEHAEVGNEYTMSMVNKQQVCTSVKKLLASKVPKWEKPSIRKKEKFICYKTIRHRYPQAEKNMNETCKEEFDEDNILAGILSDLKNHKGEEERLWKITSGAEARKTTLPREISKLQNQETLEPRC